MSNPVSTHTSSHSKAFGLWSAALLGIGAMVGAGIFVVIGQAAAIAGAWAWLSFFFGGLISLAAGYSLARLALTFPSRGGIVEYLVQLYGEGPLAGAGGVLFYLAQVIAIAAVAKAFGIYGAQLFGTADPLWQNALALGILLLFALINTLGASWVSRSESLIVMIKLGILILFTLLAWWHADLNRLHAPFPGQISPLLFAAGLTFFAYQGFSLICNTVEDMDSPQRNLPRAIGLAIGLVTLLYVSISVAVLGNLSLPELLHTQEYALAEAARPFLGEAGFHIMAAAALIATASAINATLYATSEITYTLVRKGALPIDYTYHRFSNREALWMTVLLVSLLLFMALDQITLLATFSILVIQVLVHLAHAFQTERTGARPLWIWLAAGGMIGILGLMLVHSQTQHPGLALMLMGLMGLALLVEMVLYHRSGRRLTWQCGGNRD